MFTNYETGQICAYMCYAFRLRKSSTITPRARWLVLLFSLSGGVFSLIVTDNLAAQTRSARIQQGPIDLVRGLKFKEGTLLVRFRPNVPQIAMQAAHSASRARVTGEFSAVDRLQVVQLPAGASVPDAVRQYRSDFNVLYTEPDYLVQAFDVTANDPQFRKTQTIICGWMYLRRSPGRQNENTGWGLSC